jgi:Na+/H+ antiporter NhaC
MAGRPRVRSHATTHTPLPPRRAAFRTRHFAAARLCALLLALCFGAAGAEVRVESPRVSLTPLGTTLTVHPETSATELRIVVRDVTSGVIVHDAVVQRETPDIGFVLSALTPPGGGKRLFEIAAGVEPSVRASVRLVPGWISLLPPLLAISLAVLLRQVVVALFAGIFVGALFVYDFNILTASLRVVDTYALGQLQDGSNASLIMFTLLLGGMVGIIGRSGGAQGIAESVTRFATSARRGQLTAWGLGCLVFFDDYANSLLVGPTMRPITDRLRVSREKLAFIVDGTSAPVASLALVSSWIGVEVGYINSELQSLSLDMDAYWVFVRTLPYRFYPFLMLFAGFVLVAMGRDFGPMWRAEKRARTEGKLLAEGATPATDFDDVSMAPPVDKPRRWLNAALPLVAVLVTVLIGLYLTGRASVRSSGDVASLPNIIGNADSFRALLWGSFVGCFAAILMAVGGRILSLADTMQAWVAGLRSMLFALVILVLSWSLGQICKSDLHTGEYLVRVLSGALHPGAIPVLVFLVAAFTSFATGSSWGTMAILFPLVVPLAHGLAPGDSVILLGAISSILAGSVWGDHCSPISDTTILSSLATSCDHLDHVRTQIPYAVMVAVVAMLLGDVPSAFIAWYSPWMGMLLGAAALVLLIRGLGKPVPGAATTTTGHAP